MACALAFSSDMWLTAKNWLSPKMILEGKEVEEINFEGSQLEKQVINKGTNTLSHFVALATR